MQKITVPKNINLSSKVILVTGATAGIGREVAKQLAKAGATVILLGRIIKKLEIVYDEIFKELEKTFGSNIENEPAIYPLNLMGANDEDYDEMATNIQNNYTQLDGLLLNAAILGNLSPIKNYVPQQWYKVMQVNLNSSFMMIQSLFPLLDKSKNASILFTSSGVAKQAKANWGAYAISKTASDQLMKILALEHQNSHLRFNSFSPGEVATRMWTSAFPGKQASLITQVEEIAPHYLYLLSDYSKNLNGLVINKSDFY